ncbi:MAG: hypothetical protein ACREFP_13980 [Acetobacteraceae bacterium]
MRKAAPPAPAPPEAPSAVEGKAEAIERACKLAPGMIDLLGQIAHTPEPARDAATRARCAVEILRTAGLIAAGASAAEQGEPNANE